MNFSKRRLAILAAIALVCLVVLTFFLAPSRDRLSSGSTYSRAPDGYGAWYAFMEKQGTPVRRWERSFAALEKQASITLLRVRGGFGESQLNSAEQQWIERGNTLVTLGVWQPVTEAPFSSSIESSQGEVKIETGRRASLEKEQSQLLGDRFGAIVWEETIKKGRAIWIVTPHFAANAYQNEPGNFSLLAQILTETDRPIWVDEYLHGYRDPEDKKEEVTIENWVDYLAQTPLLPIAVQGGIILLVAIVAQNRRFGRPQPIDPPETNNSKTYIQALGSVLHKAGSREFVAKTIGKAEQLALQEHLGLGTNLLEPEAVLPAWEVQTGRSAAELQSLLQSSSKRKLRSDRQLLNWLEKWKTLRK
ncbi:MAG TPA: DUF4350 domain-containing protein [Oscillatoriales cyanobacterium M59_W2019_021]|nr:DUF4350 domain-containing protein [Oscillatoriales cyanobacterium M4454_W2019_049]HIK49687.1 DUF4350 domain-containing protein [Oscillatoriales cyanobacterium M59_W2019_021]